MPARCTHLDRAHTNTPKTDGCEECLAMGDTWVHLRLCRTCGHVGCCDDSKNRNATKHFGATRSDEDDGNPPSPGQFLLQFGSAHSRHLDIENEATRLVNAIGCEKFLRLGEDPDCVAELKQQLR